LPEVRTSLTAKATDPAGNTSGDSTAIHRDGRYHRADGRWPGTCGQYHGSGLDTDLMVTFNEKHSERHGRKIVLKRSRDHSTVETIAVSSAAVAVAGNTVTIARSVTLGVLTDYYGRGGGRCP